MKHNSLVKAFALTLVDFSDTEKQYAIECHSLKSKIGCPMLRCICHLRYCVTVPNHECQLMTQTELYNSNRRSEKKLEIIMVKLSVDWENLAHRKWAD